MADVAIIPLDRGSGSGYDELTGSTPQFVNLLVAGAPGGDAARAIRTRPGVRSWSGPASFPSTDPVTRMAALNGRLFYVTDNGSGTRKAYGIAPDGVTVVEMSLAGGTTLIDGFDAMKMATWRAYAFVAGGGAPQKIDVGMSSSRLGGGPPSAADLCVLNQRLVIVAPDTSGLFFWSGISEGAVETWDLTFEFREAEARPDPLVGCDATTRRLFMFGTETLQVFAPDGDETFAAETAVEVGCASKRSIIRDDQVIRWADDRKRIVVTNGADVQVLSDQGIGATLDGLSTFADCWAFRAKIGPFDLVAWVFPTDGVTYAWDKISQTWSEWRARDAATGAWKPWAPTSYIYAFGKHLVGMPDGSIAELTLEAHSDLGAPLAWVLRTGFREVEKRRHTFDARFICRRGETNDPTASIGVRWRDDLGAFTPKIDCPLGPLGDYEANAVISPAGMPYRRRQWELSGSADVAYLIAGAKETYEEAEV